MNHLDPLGILNKKNTNGLNKLILRNYVQLVARNLIRDLPTISEPEYASGRLLAHLEVRKSLALILGSDGYTKQIEGTYNLLNKKTEHTYNKKIIRASRDDKQTFNYVMKQLTAHAIMFSEQSLESNNEKNIILSKGLLTEYLLLRKSLISVVPKGVSHRITKILEEIEIKYE